MILVGSAGLVVVVNLVVLAIGFYVTLRTVRIGGAQCGSNILEADAVFLQRIRIELDPDSGQGAAADDDLTDTFDL